MQDKKSRLFTTFIIIFGVVFVLLFAYFVWPSQFKYTNLYLGILGRQQIRENRFTGLAEICGAGKWQEITLEGDTIGFKSGVTFSIGGSRNSCNHGGWFGLVELIGAGLIEVVLVIVLIVEKKRQRQQLVPIIGIQ